MTKPTADQIDAILPQTQCGLCTYDGCKPYAEAIAKGEDSINRCPPGGVSGLKKLGELTGINPKPYLAEMEQEQKPLLTAVIREDECIGCTKCISACPVDAILGASKKMHTIITDECNGCELCVEPCPVDCIDIIKIGEPDSQDEKTVREKATQYRKRYYQREARLARDKALLKHKHDLAKLAYKKIAGKEASLGAKKQAIAEAVARVKARKK